jgi:hypothetical protein
MMHGQQKIKPGIGVRLEVGKKGFSFFIICILTKSRPAVEGTSRLSNDYWRRLVQGLKPGT